MNVRAGMILGFALAAGSTWLIAAPLQRDAPVFVQQPPAPPLAGPAAPPPPSQIERPESPRVQQVPVGGGALVGTITAADTGRPLRSVTVTLQGATDIMPKSFVEGVPRNPGAAGLGLTRLATTDAQGQFIFDSLPAGRFTLQASRSGFLATAYGTRAYGRPGKTIVLGPDQRTTIDFAIVRAGVISGFVSGEDGEPLAGARIQVYRYGFVNGAKRLQMTNGATTDDRGGYRVTNLQPGDYLVSAIPNNSDLVHAERAIGERMAFEAALAARGNSATDIVALAQSPGPAEYTFANFAPTYYPGSPGPAGASAVRLGPGEDRSGIDVRAQAWRNVTIRGTVNIAPGFPYGVTVSVQPAEPEFLALTQSTARANADGAFVLRNIPPGSYVISAQTSTATMAPTVTMADGNRMMLAQPPRQPQAHEMMFARTTVTVSGDDTPTVSLELRPGRSVSGQMASAALGTSGRGSRTVALQSIGPGEAPVIRAPEPVQVQADGRFRIDGVMPGRYVFRAGPLKSAMVGGIDTLDFPLEINGDEDIAGVVLTAADRSSGLLGRILEANGEPAHDYTIVVIPDDPRYWVPGSRRIVATRAGGNGDYAFENLPAGGYYLAALADLETGAQYDPTFLRDLARAAMRVTIADGQRHVQDIRVR